MTEALNYNFVGLIPDHLGAMDLFPRRIFFFPRKKCIRTTFFYIFGSKLRGNSKSISVQCTNHYWLLKNLGVRVTF